MTLMAALIEPSVGLYTAVRLEFLDSEPRRVIFAGLDHALAFHERAEELIQQRAPLKTCVAAAQASAGFVRI